MNGSDGSLPRSLSFQLLASRDDSGGFPDSPLQFHDRSARLLFHSRLLFVTEDPLVVGGIRAHLS